LLLPFINPLPDTGRDVFGLTLIIENIMKYEAYAPGGTQCRHASLSTMFNKARLFYIYVKRPRIGRFLRKYGTEKNNIK